MDKKVVISVRRSIPKIVINIREALIYICGSSLTLVGFLAEKLHITVEEFASGVGVIIIAVKFIAILFGVGDANVMTITKELDKELTKELTKDI